ncbi:hypothetical protein CDL15_Pgr022360 [Punica granatum]|uniref:Uncharacterized protein n=1 Tax=Punica granatum TaxID=22663 RepID=A0A218Y462_PUNGR|nr:hypothetical protein CDL15_Pgr022360 [Punica granatum]
MSWAAERLAELGRWGGLGRCGRTGPKWAVGWTGPNWAEIRAGLGPNWATRLGWTDGASRAAGHATCNDNREEKKTVSRIPGKRELNDSVAAPKRSNEGKRRGRGCRGAEGSETGWKGRSSEESREKGTN